VSELERRINGPWTDPTTGLFWLKGKPLLSMSPRWTWVRFPEVSIS
jgi:hypothetical protein